MKSFLIEQYHLSNYSFKTETMNGLHFSFSDAGMFQSLKYAILLLTSIFFFSIKLQAQDTTYYYLDTGYQSWITTTKDKAEFYRPLPLKKEGDFFKVEDYYINGNLQMTGLSSSEERDLFEGLVTWYYSNGEKQQTTAYKNGKKNGAYTFFYTDGSIKAAGTYENNRPMNGTFVQEGRYGANVYIGVMEIFEYENNKIIGGITTYTNSQQIAERAFIDHANESIKSVYYDRAGEEIGQYRCTLDDKEKNGIEIYFHKDGYQATTIGTIENYQENTLNGETRSYDNFGNISTEGIYKDGLPFNGSFESNDSFLTYKDGKLDGRAIYYNESDQEVANGIYKDGSPWDGQFIESIYSGELKSYKNGKLEGKQITYFDGGTFNQIADYHHMVNHKKEGEAGKFNESGDVIAKGIYKNDKPWQGTFYIENGAWAYQIATYANGALNGAVTEYNFNGNFVLEKEFKDGIATGWESNLNPYTNKKHRVLKQPSENYGSKIIEGEYYDLGYLRSYKSGHLIKEVQYDEDNQTPKAIETFAIRTNVDKDTEFPTERIERMYFQDGREFRLVYKNDLPYEGIYHDGLQKIMFKNGKKVGEYIHYSHSEQGPMIANYEDDLIQGEVFFVNNRTGDTTSCIYRDSLPFEGIDLTQNGSFSYKNGKKNGIAIQSTYNFGNADYIIDAVKMTQVYKEGILDGPMLYYDKDDQILEEAAYKNGSPYEGNFYAFIHGERKTYSKGKLTQHIFSERGYIIDILYDEDAKMKSGISSGADKILQGIYKNGQPYEGTFYKEEKIPSYSMHFDKTYTITNYKKGKKDGVKKYFSEYRNRLIQQRNYKNDELISLTAYDLNFRGQEEISLSYKNGRPYSGQLMTTQENLFILSSYEDGHQSGYTYYLDDKDRGVVLDSLYFDQSLPTEGGQLEYRYSKVHRHFYKGGQLAHSRTYAHLSHHNTASYQLDDRGEQVPIPVSAVTNDMPIEIIDYTENGFEITYTKQSEHHADQAHLDFDNDSQTSGTITYTKRGNPLGYFKFSNGKITDLDSTETYTSISIDDKGHIFRKDTLENFTYIFYPIYQLSTPPSYQDFCESRALFSRDGLVDVFVDGSTAPVCSFEIKDREIYNGTYIEPDGKATYEYAFYKAGERIIKERNLSLEKVLEKVKQIKD